MDYEKKYNEALEKARKYMAKGYDVLMPEIFPELAESEDERIRKRIRLCLDECVHSDIIRDYERDECLTYLEKQKESLHISETCEEKPNSFTDKDKKMLERVLESLVCYRGKVYDEGEGELASEIDEEIAWMQAWEEQNPLSPDEKMNHSLFLEGFDVGREVGKVEAEQKPAEWSEEEKQKLNRIYEILGYAADDKGFLTSKRIIGDKEAIELQDFLKSPRSCPKSSDNWKPSEEQLFKLYRIAEGVPDDDDAEVLIEIYEQLTKLM